MGDEGEFWSDVKPELKRISRLKRQSNRDNGQSELFVRNIEFLVRNEGAHLIVCQGTAHRVDYWPGTGLWQSAGGYSGRGIRSLLAFLERRGIPVEIVR